MKEDDKINQILNSEQESDEEDYYDEYFNTIMGEEYYENFLIEIDNLKRLNDYETPSLEMNNILLRQNYIAAIGTLETVLSDTFINSTLKNKVYLKNFIKSNPDFKKQKFSLSEIFEQMETINDIVKNVMISTIFHDLGKVKRMYEDTFNMNFPDICLIASYVGTRHDLVHRNGKNKKGEFVMLDTDLVNDVLRNIELFVIAIFNSSPFKQAHMFESDLL